MPLEATHELSIDSDAAVRMSRAKQAESNSPKGSRLEAGDEGPEPNYKLYVYNVLPLEHEINQPPAFPRFIIPAKKSGERFGVTTLPVLVKERYEKPGSTEYFYKRVDGRKYATSLLNPAAFPGTSWEAQLQNWRSNDQFGNNFNALGCFWSLTDPNDEKLEGELEQFRARAVKTLNELARKAESLYNSKKEDEITPLMHFAMDFLHKQAPWHLRSDMLVDCPTCGEPVKEGIAYHRNSFGDKCPVDYEKCRALGIIPAEGLAAATPAPVARPATPSSESSEEDELETAAAAGASKEVATLTKGKKKVAAPAGKK